MIGLLIASGVGQYAAVMVLFGSSLFALYAGVGSRASENSTTDRRMQHWLARILCSGALLAVIFAFGALLAVASRMSGDMVDALHRETLLSVVFAHPFRQGLAGPGRAVAAAGCGLACRSDVCATASLLCRNAARGGWSPRRLGVRRPCDDG